MKLHLQWPDRKQYDGKDDQAMEFFKWLFLNHHSRPEVMELGDEQDVDEFLEKNKHVLWPTKKEEEKWANLRLEPRIVNDISVELTVMECDEIEMIGTSINGRTLDIGLHGMRLTITDNVPAGTILKLVVAKEGHGDKRYSLIAELRWSTDLEEGHLVGVKLVEKGEFTEWQTDFGKEFVAPVMARRRRS
ncbi:MAG: PilZ domain-containing protein [Gammaproteobacteria bacterium]|nr:PilZ domain-containing protein [Gammaproteobacteria bacterium]